MAQGSVALIADLRRTASETDNLDAQTQSELKRLQAEAQSLRQNWQSARSGKSFDQTMIQWNQDAVAMQRAMKDIADLMRATASRYERLEEDNEAATRLNTSGRK